MSAAKPLPDKRTSEANNSVSKSVSKRRNKAHMGCGRRRGVQAPRAEVSANSSSGADEWTAVTDKRCSGSVSPQVPAGSPRVTASGGRGRQRDDSGGWALTAASVSALHRPVCSQLFTLRTSPPKPAGPARELGPSTPLRSLLRQRRRTSKSVERMAAKAATKPKSKEHNVCRSVHCWRAC